MAMISALMAAAGLRRRPAPPSAMLRDGRMRLPCARALAGHAVLLLGFAYGRRLITGAMRARRIRAPARGGACTRCRLDILGRRRWAWLAGWDYSRQIYGRLSIRLQHAHAICSPPSSYGRPRISASPVLTWPLAARISCGGDRAAEPATMLAFEPAWMMTRRRRLLDWPPRYWPGRATRQPPRGAGARHAPIVRPRSDCPWLPGPATVPTRLNLYKSLKVLRRSKERLVTMRRR